MIQFAVENIGAVWANMDIVTKHYDEIAQFKDVQKLAPDFEAYDRMEKAGKLWVMTVRDEGILIGYIVMFLSNDLHYRELRRATEDIHFIVPEHRKGILGYKMLARMKEEMKLLGVHTITVRTKADNSHGVLFERLGGVLHDLVYTIVL
jgi:hypothetical protein